MKPFYKLSQQAERGIENIAQYIWEVHPKSAIQFVEEVERICQKLAKMPEAGRYVEFIKTSEYYFFPVGRFKKFLIFYQTENNIPEIVRVLHSRMDIERLFEED